MKAIFLHGLGQTAKDWEEVVRRVPSVEAGCPDLFSLSEEITYSRMLEGLEKRYGNEAEPFCLCGLSLGAVLALDYTLRHGENVASLVLLGVQYRMPRILIDLQNFVFRFMPKKAFQSMGISKNDAIRLTHSMRSLDFSEKVKEIRCPVTIVCGERDYANLKAARKLKELIPQAKLYIVPGAGHELNMCAPKAVAAIVEKVLA